MGIVSKFLTFSSHGDLHDHGVVIPVTPAQGAGKAYFYVANLEGANVVGEYKEVPAEVFDNYEGSNKITLSQIAVVGVSDYQSLAFQGVMGLMNADDFSGVNVEPYDLETLFDGMTADDMANLYQNTDFLQALAAKQTSLSEARLPDDFSPHGSIETPHVRLGAFTDAYNKVLFAAKLPAIVQDFENSLIDGRAAEAGVPESVISNLQEIVNPDALAKTEVAFKN